MIMHPSSEKCGSWMYACLRLLQASTIWQDCLLWAQSRHPPRLLAPQTSEFCQVLLIVRRESRDGICLENSKKFRFWLVWDQKIPDQCPAGGVTNIGFPAMKIWPICVSLFRRFHCRCSTNNRTMVAELFPVKRVNQSPDIG